MRATACLNCGARLDGSWCGRCGQRHREASDRTVRSLVGEAFAALTSYDSRVWRTFVTLLLRPGRITLDHIEGRRAPYLGPVTVFLLTSVIFYLVVPMHADFRADAGIDARILLLDADLSVDEWIAARVAAGGGTLEQFGQRYSQRAPELKKALTIAFAPALALPLALVFRRRDRLFADHVVFAFHLAASVMILAIVLVFPLGLGFVASYVPGQPLGAAGTLVAGAISIAMPVGLVAWLAAALRRVYVLHWRWAVPAAVGVVLLLVAASIVLRDLRDTVILWWLS